jgi:hypothetical protein
VAWPLLLSENGLNVFRAPCTWWIPIAGMTLAACGSLNGAQQAFCEQRPDVCGSQTPPPDSGLSDAGTTDAGMTDAGSADAGQPLDAGCSCAGPTIFMPKQNEPCGTSINLQVDAGMCLVSLTATLDGVRELESVSGSGFPQPNWLPKSSPNLDAGTHTLVVDGVDGSGHHCPSPVLTFKVCLDYPNDCP